MTDYIAIILLVLVVVLAVLSGFALYLWRKSRKGAGPAEESFRTSTLKAINDSFGTAVDNLGKVAKELLDSRLKSGSEDLTHKKELIDSTLERKFHEK